MDNQQIQEETYCIVLRTNAIKIWLTEKAAKTINNILLNLENQKFINLNNNKIININDIVGIFPRKDIDENSKERQGYWTCEHGYKHKKGEQCGHGLMAQYQK